MKKSSFKIIIGGAILIIIAFFIAIKLYNKPHVDTKKSKADFVLTAQNLISDFLQDEISAEQKYANQVLQINGEIHKISTLNGNGVITLKFTNLDSSIICHLQPEENKKILLFKKGQKITVKGICTGYLLDVIMVNCVLPN